MFTLLMKCHSLYPCSPFPIKKNLFKNILSYFVILANMLAEGKAGITTVIMLADNN